MLAALGGLDGRAKPTPPPPPPLPTPPPASAPAPAPAPAGRVHPDEVEDGAEDDEWDSVPDEVIEDYESALECWLTFTTLMLELHDNWDDHDGEETERRAVTAEVKGRAWVRAVRKHSKYTCTHYYCHVVFAHLRMLISCNGHPFCGDDAVLERGHQIFKRLRKISSAGGKARVGGKRAIQKSCRSKKLPSGQYGSVTVNSAARVLQEEQIARMARVLVKRRATRPSAAPSGAVVATQLRKSEARAGVKAESVRVMDQDPVRVRATARS